MTALQIKLFKKRERENTLHEYSQCAKGHTGSPLNHVWHIQNVTGSVYNYFILKLYMSYISAGELRHRCYDVNCFSGAQKGLSSLQASDCSLFHMYVNVAGVLLTLLFFFSHHGTLVHGTSYFSSFSTCSVI